MYKGHCGCKAVSYTFEPEPIYTHCCHCTDCQRESGSAFAINVMIETSALIVDGEIERIKIPSRSGKGQTFIRCPKCKISLWSHYAGAGAALAFVRAGTLEDQNAITPDIHIFIRSKLDWVKVPNDVPSFKGYYDRTKVWPMDKLARRKAAGG